MQNRCPKTADYWEQRKLSDLGKTFNGLSGKTKDDFGHGQAQFVTYMNVYQNPIAKHDGLEHVEIDHKQNSVQYGDTFFTTSSETPEEVGMSSVWLYNDTNTYLNSFCFGYRLNTIKAFDLYYYATVLRAPLMRAKFQFLAQGISRYNISKRRVLNLSIPYPQITEQEEIGRFFTTLDATIALHQRSWLKPTVNKNRDILTKMVLVCVYK